MSDAVKRAEAAVQEAQQDSQMVELVAALLAAQAQQQAQQPTCQHHPAPVKPSGAAAKWLAIGIAGSFLAVALAVSMVAFAIGAVALTVCVLVLRSVWQQWQQEKED